MIAACPKCAARYRVDRERLSSGGLRLRCTKCRAVFRVRAPSAPERTPAPPAAPPAAEPPQAAPPDGPVVLVALPSEDMAKQIADALRERRMQPFVVHDGVEAMLEIQRKLPQVVLLSASLPKMYGFQVCEVVKRNPSLRSIFVVLAGAVHHRERYRRPPGDLYGADAYLEEPDLPDALIPILEDHGILGPGPNALPAPAEAAPKTPPAPPPAGPPVTSPEPPPAAVDRAPSSSATPAAPRAPSGPPDPLAQERAKAERLARIIVSDIVLYNQEKFDEAARNGNVEQALAVELDEGRALLRERVDERVRRETDHLREELLRVARAREIS